MNAPSTNRPILSAVFSEQGGGDRAPLLEALKDVVRQDPNIQVTVEPSKNLVVVAGMSVAHLVELRGHLLNEYGLRVTISNFKVLCVETIRKKAEAEGKYIRQTGGSGNYGHCWLRIEPNEAGNGYEFINVIKGGVVPKEYIAPIDQGVQDALEFGILGGFPMVDVKVTLFDGSHHEVDSNEMAFRFAGSIAFKEAARRASPVLLEPVMAVKVTVPEEHMGTIIDDINSRHGRIEGMAHQAGSQVIKAIMPLSELIAPSCSRRIRESPMEFAGYMEVQRGGFDGTNPGVPAILPKRPNHGRGSVAVRPEFEAE